MREPNLEAAISESDDGWLVYADWFEERSLSHRATAMRVLAGREAKTSLERDASRLISLVNVWIQAEPDPDAFPVGEVSETRVLSSEEVRERRPRENVGAWLTLFFEVWGESSPFDEDATLANELAAQTTVDATKVPKSVRFESLAFEHVVIAQNGTTGVDGVALFGELPRRHAADVLFARLNGVEFGELDGVERSEAFPLVTIDEWLPMSRATYFNQLFSWRAGNEGHELRRGGEPQPLMAFFAELGPLRESAWGGDDSSMHAVLRFDDAWVMFSATM